MQRRNKKKGEKFLLEWMKSRLDDYWASGLQHSENFQTGILLIRHLVWELDKLIKEHLKMECV